MSDELKNKLIELKAQVYDLLAQRQLIDQHLNNLNLQIQQINQQITANEPVLPSA